MLNKKCQIQETLENTDGMGNKTLIYGDKNLRPGTQFQKQDL